MPVTVQYPAAKTRTYWGYSSIAEDAAYFQYSDTWSSNTDLRQGRFVIEYWDEYGCNIYSGNAYGAMHFGTGTGKPTELSGRALVSARLFLHRKAGNGTRNVQVFKTSLADVPNASSHTNCDYITSGGYLSAVSYENTGTWYDIPLNLAQAAINGYCLTIYYGSSYYSLFFGVESADKPILEITYLPAEPNLSAPVLDTIDTISADSNTFHWTGSTDANGAVNNSDITYEMQISTQEDPNWGAVHATAANTPEYTENLRTYLSLAAGQYCLLPFAQVRVRACADYSGTTYYSAYAASNAFAIDYRIPPAAPAMLTVDNAAPYEGQAVVFTIGRPSEYNTLDHLGATMGIRYYIQLADSTALKDVAALVTDATKNTASYTVGNLTTAIADRATTIQANGIDAESQVGAFKTGTSFTIKRFRAPTVVVSNIDRASSSATVHIIVTDTGFAAVQYSTEIASVHYSIGAGPVAASLGAWGGSSGAFTNSFTISGLSESTTASLAVSATNVPPGALGAKTSADYALSSIYEYTPAFYMFKDASAAVGGFASKSGIIGDSTYYAHNPAAGVLDVQYDVKVGGTSLKADSVSATDKILGRATPNAGAIEEIACTAAGRALLDDANAAAQRATLGLGTIATHNASGADASAITGTPGASGNLAAWNGDGDAVDGMLAASAAPKLVDRQNNTTNTTVGNQLIQVGWGFIQGTANSGVGETVTYPVAFDDVPIVNATAIGYVATSGGTPTSQSSFGGGSTTYCDAPTPSASQVTVRCMNRDSSNLSTSYYYGYSWIAIGTKAR